MKTIHKILFLSIFMLIAFNYSVFSQSTTFCGGCDNAENIILDGVFSMKVGECDVDVTYDFRNCGTPPNQIPTLDIKQINIDNCGGATPDEDEVMSQVKRHMLLFTHYWSNDPSPVPDDFEVAINAPACFEFVSNGTFSESFAIYPPNLFKIDCPDCCSNTYTIDATGSSVYIDNIDRRPSNSTSCTFGSTCVNACAEDELEEGDLVSTFIDNSCYSESSGTISFKFFESTIDQGTYTANFNSVMYFTDNFNGSYEVSPFFINSKMNRIDSEDRFQDYIEELLFKRESVLGVDKEDDMILKLKPCWKNEGQNTYPCANDVCCSFTFTFMPPNYTTYTRTGTSSATCSAPCDINVCERISNNMNGGTITNQKAIFDIEKNEDIHSKVEIYPNPSFGLATIKIESELNGQGKFKIHTVDGQTIATRIFSKESDVFNYEINTKSFTNGTYYIGVYIDEKNIKTLKLIINN